MTLLTEWLQVMGLLIPGILCIGLIIFSGGWIQGRMTRLKWLAFWAQFLGGLGGLVALVIVAVVWLKS